MLGRVGDCVRAVQSLMRVRVFLESKSLMSVCESVCVCVCAPGGEGWVGGEERNF